MRTTRVNGTTRWTPEGSTRLDTLPKKSSTPTLPAGITTTGLRKAKKKMTATAIRARRSPLNAPEGGRISNTLGMEPPCSHGRG